MKEIKNVPFLNCQLVHRAKGGMFFIKEFIIREAQYWFNTEDIYQM